VRPQARHAHIYNSPALSIVQISQNRSILNPLKFALEASDFSALLTALLTKFSTAPLRITQEVEQTGTAKSLIEKVNHIITAAIQRSV